MSWHYLETHVFPVSPWCVHCFTLPGPEPDEGSISENLYSTYSSRVRWLAYSKTHRAWQAAQMGVSFRSLLGEGFTRSLAALTSRTPSQGGGPMPPRLSGSSSSCSCCSDFARCIWSSRSCTRSSMMASRSSWTAWFRWLFFILGKDKKGSYLLSKVRRTRNQGRAQTASHPTQGSTSTLANLAGAKEDTNMNMQMTR